MWRKYFLFLQSCGKFFYIIYEDVTHKYLIIRELTLSARMARTASQTMKGADSQAVTSHRVTSTDAGKVRKDGPAR